MYGEEGIRITALTTGSCQHPMAVTPRSPFLLSRRSVLGVCAVAWVGGMVRSDVRRDDGAVSREQLAAHELARAAHRVQLCSGRIAAGVGLRGEYFAGEHFTGERLLERVDPGVDLNRSLDWPPSMPMQRPRSVRWSGWIKPPLSGLYRFHLEGVDGRVTVANQRLLGEPASPDAAVELAAGRFYSARVEVPSLPADKPLRLEWTAPHGARFLVPRALLYLPSETVAAARG